MNERLETVVALRSSSDGVVDFLCECADIGCMKHVQLTTIEYEAMRSDSRQFAVVPGHVKADFEHVVEQKGRFTIVRKTGGAGEIAEDMDPRSDA